MDTDSQIKIYYEQIEFCYGNVEWTHKIHEKAADIYTCINTWIRWFQLLLSFFVSADVVSQMNTESPVIHWYLVVCSLLLMLVNTISKGFDFGGLANKHIITANSLWGLREEYRSFKNDILAGIYTIDEIRARRDELQNAVQEVYKTAPRTFGRAYKKAKSDFESGNVTFNHLSEK
ncbi:MAG: SLATT domain-containing protein [Bacteroidales bacterium]|nr:SLATT domain-containing protein [Bacteroidales bacterium]